MRSKTSYRAAKRNRARRIRGEEVGLSWGDAKKIANLMSDKFAQTSRRRKRR
jgi:hypothetical protein